MPYNGVGSISHSQVVDLTMGFVEVLVFLFQFFSSILISVIRLIPYFRPPPKDVRGEIVLVTGAGHGMGRLEAIEFGKRGATVIVVDINEEGNNETANMVREMGTKVYSFQCDVSKKDNIKQLARAVRDEVGDVTILVNNAGVIYVADILSLTDEKIQRTFDVNIIAHFWLVREFLPAMKRKNHGHIVALASQGGLEGGPFLTDYCASKHAVVGMCNALRRELRWLKYDGIHVTYICPLFVNTGFVRNPSSTGVKIFTPEEVVAELMTAVLNNVPFVTLPKLHRLSLFSKSLMPHATQEVVFDFIGPKCELDQSKKTT